MTHDLMVLGRVTLDLYKECALKAFRGLRANWILIPGAIALLVLGVMLARAVSATLPPHAAGFILGLAMTALISLYYSWLNDTLRRDRLRFTDLLKFDVELFWGLVSVGFIFWIAGLLLDQLLRGIEAAFFRVCVQLVIVILFNPVPETIYAHRFRGLHALSHSAAFTQVNWIEWFLPFLLFMLPALGWSYSGEMGHELLNVFTATDPLLPLAAFMRPWLWRSASVFGGSFVGVFLALAFTVVVGSWFMLFRGHLFLALDTSSRRQRIFQGRR